MTTYLFFGQLVFLCLPVSVVILWTVVTFFFSGQIGTQVKSSHVYFIHKHGNWLVVRFFSNVLYIIILGSRVGLSLMCVQAGVKDI